MKIKVSNLISDSGNNVANQFKIKTSKGTYFQSYDTIIAFIPFGQDDNAKIQLDSNYWNYSRTTSKYRNRFLGLTTDQTKRAIDTDRIKLTNLNK